MEELFRFVVLRPPRRMGTVIVLDGIATSLGQRLIAIGRGEQARAAILTAVDAFMDGPDFTRGTSTLPLYQELSRLRRSLAREEQVTLSSLARMIQQIFGHAASAVVADARFTALRVRVNEAILALKIKPARWPRLLAEYVQLVRLIDLIARVAAGDRTLDAQTPRALLRRSVTLPEELFPLPGAAAKATQPPDGPAQERARKVAQIDAQIRDLDTAVNEVSAFGPSDFTAVVSSAAAPSATAEVASLDARVRILEKMLREHPAGHTSASLDAHASVPALAAANVASSAKRVVDVPALAVIATPAQSLLRASAAARLTSRTRELLRALEADPADTPLEIGLERLQSEAQRLAAERASLGPLSVGTQLVRVGGTTLPAPTPGALDVDDLASPEAPKVPTTVGLVRPSGLGSLLVVKQQIKSYIASDISHVENVLARESSQHETRRLERTEETLTTETETTRQQERDLQSTERLEMRKEAQSTIKEDERFKIGATISGGFGSFVQAEVTTEYETGTAQEDAEQTARSYASDVTQRTASKLTERIRTEHTIRTIEEFEEKNAHGFDNTQSAEHVIGIYQWLDRVYQAQVYDYGIRLFFDVMVPEPAAFLLQAIESRASAVEGLKRPPPFNRKPSELTAQNYHAYVRDYQATDVEPPLPATLVLSIPLAGATQAATDPELTSTQEIAIPEGYYAKSAQVSASFVAWEEVDGEPVFDSAALWIHVGRKHWKKEYADGVFDKSLTLDSETASVPIALRTLFVSSYVATIEVSCPRSEAHFEKWQLKTHAAITQGYLKLQQAYEEKLAALSVQDTAQSEGRNPDENRIIERTELKRQAISIITGQYFEEFGAIRQSATQEARIDFDEALAEGQYVRFFEQAFDWDNMTYELYPYYWARRTTWVDRLLTEDVDTLHAQFLKAGYARLRIPVRPDFERGLFHFLDTGSVWDGGELPDIGTSGHLALLEDIKQRRDVNDQEIAVGTPWDIHLPTTLVRLKPTPTLPAWQLNEQGEWVPVPE